VPKQGDRALSPTSTGSRVSTAAKGDLKHNSPPILEPEPPQSPSPAGFVMGTVGPDDNITVAGDKGNTPAMPGPEPSQSPPQAGVKGTVGPEETTTDASDQGNTPSMPVHEPPQAARPAGYGKVTVGPEETIIYPAGNGNTDSTLTKPKSVTTVSTVRAKQTTQTRASNEGDQTKGRGGSSMMRSTMLSKLHTSVKRGTIRKWGRRLKPVVTGNAFKSTVMIALVVALFGNPLTQLADVPDDPWNSVLDVIMLLIMGLFVAETVLNSIVFPLEYPLSFFFWMDIVGTISMVFEVSFLLGQAGRIKETHQNDFNAVLLRCARLAKVPARVGRLTKVLKTCSVCLGLQDAASAGEDSQTDEKSMRNLSRQLLLTLSSKVSMLAIIFVVGLPQFELYDFPTQDLSADAWGQRLSEDYTRAYEAARASNTSRSDIFEKTVMNFRCFYKNQKHKPFRLEGFDVIRDENGRVLQIPGQFEEEAPNRKQNIWKVSVGSIESSEDEEACTVGQDFELSTVLTKDGSGPALFYNHEANNQFEAALDLGMFMFIVLIMAFSSYSVQTTVTRLVVEPLERMIDKVKGLAHQVLGIDFYKEQEEGEEDDDDADMEGMNEVQLLEFVCDKIAKLTALSVKNQCASKEELASMDHTNQAVLAGMLNQGVKTSRNSGCFAGLKTSMGGVIVTDMPVSRDVIESWNLHVLDLDNRGLDNLVLWIFFDSSIGALTTRGYTTQDVFRAFHSQIKSKYFDSNRYHNYAHACDVLHTVFRFMDITHSREWCTDIELYSLLIAALAHDLGHAGKTNQFLVETQAEIAFAYNDCSPLENYHCSNLFKICCNQDCNVLKDLAVEDRTHARKVIINAILHTDNAAHHMSMCKKLASIYEMKDEIFNEQSRYPDDLNPEYKETLKAENGQSMTFLQLFLHLADVSNPLKPFHICEAWADRVLDEFFAQGDEEKARGLPVGMLNDRDRVNRPGSQHGFIHYMVAPLVEPAVLIMQPLHVLYGNMANNLGQWCEQWQTDEKQGTQPSKEEVAKRLEVIKTHQSKAQELRSRMVEY